MTVAFVSGSGEGGIGPEVLYGDTDIKLRLMSRKALNTQSVSTNYTLFTSADDGSLPPSSFLATG